MIMAVSEAMVVVQVLMEEHNQVATNQWALHGQHQMQMDGHLVKISLANSSIKDNGIRELE